MKSIKEEAKHLIDGLPDDAGWDDIMYEMYVRQKVAIALSAAEEGKTTPHETVKKRFLSRED